MLSFKCPFDYFILKPWLQHIIYYVFNSVCYKTHYETLGIEQNATQKEIKEAYIKLGKEVSICVYIWKNSGKISAKFYRECNILYC